MRYSLELVAHCTSVACSGDLNGYSSKGVAKENAKRGQSICPDCGHTLFWIKKSSNRRPLAYRNKNKLVSDNKRSFFGE